MTSTTECEKAAGMLNQTDVLVYESVKGGVNSTKYPQGCYVSNLDRAKNSGSLNFNVNNANNGTDLASSGTLRVFLLCGRNHRLYSAPKTHCLWQTPPVSGKFLVSVMIVTTGK